MTENADVEWFRIEVTECASDDYWSDDHDFVIPFVTARRLLAHIDQLEAEVQKCRDFFTQIPPSPEPRPTVHEIAAQMAAAYVASSRYFDPVTAAVRGYDAAEALAEALVAEGRRRDGNG